MQPMPVLRNLVSFSHGSALTVRVLSGRLETRTVSSDQRTRVGCDIGRWSTCFASTTACRAGHVIFFAVHGAAPLDAC